MIAGRYMEEAGIVTDFPTGSPFSLSPYRTQKAHLPPLLVPL